MFRRGVDFPRRPAGREIGGESASALAFVAWVTDPTTLGGHAKSGSDGRERGKFRFNAKRESNTPGYGVGGVFAVRLGRSCAFRGLPTQEELAATDGCVTGGKMLLLLLN